MPLEELREVAFHSARGKRRKKKACGNEKLAASHFSSFSLDGEVEGECLGIARKQQSLLGTLRSFDLPSRAICLLDWTGLDGKACTVASLDGRSRVQKRKDEKKKAMNKKANISFSPMRTRNSLHLFKRT